MAGSALTLSQPSRSQGPKQHQDPELRHRQLFPLSGPSRHICLVSQCLNLLSNPSCCACPRTQGHLVSVKTQQVSVSTCFIFPPVPGAGQRQPTTGASGWDISPSIAVTSCLGLASAGSSKATLFPVYFQRLAKKNVQYEKNVYYPQFQTLWKKISGGLLNKRNNYNLLSALQNL